MQLSITTSVVRSCNSFETIFIEWDESDVIHQVQTGVLWYKVLKYDARWGAK